MLDRDQLLQIIAAQETLRPTLGDAVVDATISILKQKLDPPNPATTAPEQRKMVSILFADTVSSTAFSQHLDPEDVLEIMNGALRIYTDTVYAHEGTVARLMGDAVLAFFGAPTSREDDPARAIRCGLALVRAAQAYANEVEQNWGISGFNLRVGINTGMVALGEVGGEAGSEWTAMGDAINLASRLQSAAPIGGVLISHDTYRHVRGLFETRQLDPITVKGKDDPLRVYLVEREKPRTFRSSTRGVDGIHTRMVGRSLELAQLQKLFRWTQEERETQVVTIMGEPGVGKSRLLREFDEWVDNLPESVVYFTARATMERQQVPYALLRDLFAFRLDIHDSDNAATVRAKLEQGVARFMGKNSVRKAHSIGQLIGFDFNENNAQAKEDPQQWGELGLHNLTDFFAAAVSDNVGLIFLEDIHWADEKSLAAMNHVIRARRNLPLLVVCLARPALYERPLPDWMNRPEFHTLIELRPLTRHETRHLVEQLLQKAPNLPNELLDLIVNNADGNPFYVEELVKMLIDDGVIVTGAERWAIADDCMTRLHIPPTLAGVLQARLDALPPAERILLQRASVVGRIFWADTLTHLHADEEAHPVEDIPALLETLQRRDLIRLREQSAFSGTQEYIFKHTILRDVTYENVLRRVRKAYHAQTAAWLVGRTPDRANEYSGLIAEHYERAGQPEQALIYITRAGEQALYIGAFREAVNLLERAIALRELKPPAEENGALASPEAQIQEAQLSLNLGQAYRGVSNFPKAHELIQESLALAAAAQHTPGIIRALYDMGWLVGMILQRHDEGSYYFNESLAIAQKAQDKRGIAWALNGLGAVASQQGQIEKAIAHYEQSLMIAREIDDQLRIGGALSNLGMMKAAQGQYDSAREYLEQALEITQRIGRRSGIANIYTNLGSIARAQGKTDLAKRYFNDARVIEEDIGDRAGVAATLYGLGSLGRLAGEFDEALTHLQAALTIYQDIHYPAGIHATLDNMALVSRLQGNYNAAHAFLAEALHNAEQAGDQSQKADVLMQLGALESAQGHYKAAQDALNESHNLYAALGDRKGQARVLMYQGEVAYGEGRYAEAQHLNAEALKIYVTLNSRTGMVATQAGLGSAHAAQGDFDTARMYFTAAYDTAAALGDHPMMMWVLAGVADWYARQGLDEGSLEVIGTILHNPATPHEAHTRAEEVLAQVSSRMDAEAVQVALNHNAEQAPNGKAAEAWLGGVWALPNGGMSESMVIKRSGAFTTQ